MRVQGARLGERDDAATESGACQPGSVDTRQDEQCRRAGRARDVETSKSVARLWWLAVISRPASVKITRTERLGEPADSVALGDDVAGALAECRVGYAEDRLRVDTAERTEVERGGFALGAAALHKR